MNHTDDQLKQLLAKMLPEKVCGVYCFRHIESGKCYVGSSIDVYRRALTHIRKAQSGSNNYFRKSLRELGADSFNFELLEVCQPCDRLAIEGKWIKELKSTFPEGFNLYADPTIGFAYHFSDAMRAKIGASNKGKKRSEEDKARMSRQRVGRKLSPEHRKKISEALKVSAWFKGKKVTFSDEHRRNISLAAKGRKLSEETKQKLSKSRIEYYEKRRALA